MILADVQLPHDRVARLSREGDELFAVVLEGGVQTGPRFPVVPQTREAIEAVVRTVREFASRLPRPRRLTEKPRALSDDIRAAKGRPQRAIKPAAAPPTERAVGNLPSEVYGLLRGMEGQELGVVHAPHDGTVEGIRATAEALQSGATASYDWSGIQSQWIATGPDGRAGWAISPNLAHIDPVGSDEAAYTLGDLSRRPPPPLTIADEDIALVAKAEKSGALKKFLRGSPLNLTDAQDFFGVTSRDVMSAVDRSGEVLRLATTVVATEGEQGRRDARLPSLSTVYGLLNLHRLLAGRFAEELRVAQENLDVQGVRRKKPDIELLRRLNVMRWHEARKKGDERSVKKLREVDDTLSSKETSLRTVGDVLFHWKKIKRPYGGTSA